LTFDPCAPAAGRVSDLSTEVQTPARNNHRGQGMGHLQVYTVTGVLRPSGHKARSHLQRCTRAERSADPRKLLAVTTALARTSPPQLQLRGHVCPGAGDDGPRRQARGGHVACTPAAGRVISVPKYRHPRAKKTDAKGWGICRPCMSVPTRTVPKGFSLVPTSYSTGEKARRNRVDNSVLMMDGGKDSCPANSTLKYFVLTKALKPY
jgi:hypothetical protein